MSPSMSHVPMRVMSSYVSHVTHLTQMSPLSNLFGMETCDTTRPRHVFPQPTLDVSKYESSFGHMSPYMSRFFASQMLP